MPNLRLPDVDLYYEIHGTGLDVIFVHGSGGNHLSWWQQIPALSKHYRCLTWDVRGFGSSHTFAPTGDLTALCHDLLALLDHLNIRRCHLAGQSIGGHLCLRFALLYPERIHGLVLASTLAGISSPEIEATMAALGPIPEGLMDRALWRGFRDGNPQLTFLYQAIETLNHRDGKPLMPVPISIEPDKLAAITAPTFFLAAEHDPVAPPAVMAAAAKTIPGAQFQVIPGSGHSAYFETPDAFNAAVAGFLNSLGGNAGRSPLRP